MSTLNVTETKAKFSEVVDRALRGEEIIVTRMGEPVVRITRYDAGGEHRRLGLFAGQIRVEENFDEWPEEEARALGIID